MKKHLCALLLLSAGIAVSMPGAMAQEAAGTTKTTTKTATKKPAAKKTASKKTTKKTAPKAAAAAAAATTAAAGDDDDDSVPDIASSKVVDYQCELGNKLTIYENDSDKQHVALRWGKNLHRLKRVSTTTGAQRFENKKYGLVWIGIPAKGILLDSKKGQQLANECKNADQLTPKKEKAVDVSAKAADTSTVTSGSGTPVSTNP